MKTRRLVALWLTGCGMLISASSALAASGTTERISIDGAGNQGDSASFAPAISTDGRDVAFISAASNLVPGDTGHRDVFVHDREAGVTERVSVDSAGNQASTVELESLAVAISGDGRYVAFRSYRSDLVTGDTNGSPCCSAD